MSHWSAWRFTIFALVALIVVVLGATYAGLSAIVTSAHTAALEDAKGAPDLYRIYRSKLGSDALAAPAVAAVLTRNGMRAIVRDHATQLTYTASGIVTGGPFFGGPPKSSAQRFNWNERWLFAIVSTDRNQPVHVAIGAIEIVILPDPSRYLSAVNVVFAAALAVFIVVSVVIILLARSIVRAANRPIDEVTLALERLAGRDFTPRMIVADPRNRTGKLAHAYNAAAEAVAAAFDERKAAEREMQRFIADAGHELRTPLTIVSGFVDVLDGGPIDSPAAERIYATMRAETRRMRGLIEKLITLARLESPDDRRTVGPVDARSIARRVADSLTILAHPRQIHVVASESAKALADEDELFEAIFNCVENALKYAPASDVVVTIGAEHGQVVVTVADDGPGMSKDEKHHAFERFYRGDARGEITGSGLGLAIVKSTLERANGSVDLQTAPGEGTRVILRVPAASAFA